jgi:hypothetical protein
VQVKNKPCVVNIVMHLIPWKSPRGSETISTTPDEEVDHDIKCWKLTAFFKLSAFRALCTLRVQRVYCTNNFYPNKNQFNATIEHC